MLAGLNLKETIPFLRFNLKTRKTFTNVLAHDYKRFIAEAFEMLACIVNNNLPL